MKSISLYRLSAHASLIALSVTAAPAQAQSSESSEAAPQAAEAQSDEDTIMGDIIVTAQKRSQNLNDVGMSITAVSGDQLKSRQINAPEDLVRVVPSLTVTRSQYDIPIYTLRGVGFFEQSLSATPAVAMYLDQVPIPFPIMARGAAFDLERVEVLKGPQGTIFGQNSTGGLINYIAAKPTDELSAGLSLGYARFGAFNAEGFVSGPVAENVQARLSVMTNRGGAWQTSVLRPDDHLGTKRFTAGRLIVTAEPTETLRLSFNINGWRDTSDTQAPQAVDDVEAVNGEVYNPILDVSRDAQKLRFRNPRIADWTPGLDLSRDDSHISGSMRADLDVSDNATLTSITSYQRLKRDQGTDGDGTPANNQYIHSLGYIRSFSQELRLAGKAFDNRLNWTLGGNYGRDIIDDNNDFTINADGEGFLLPGVGAFERGIAKAHSKVRTLAAFANVEFAATDRLSVIGGIRYTHSRTKYNGCTIDPGDGRLAGLIGILQQFVLNVPVTVMPGECVTLRDDLSTPPSELFTTGELVSMLREDNISWHGGINWKPLDNSTLIYANVSRGYKSGSFPLTPANLTSQLFPAKQESLLAYELGFKAPVGRRLQLNGAVFYYDYSDKQIRGRVPTLFGQLETLLNIPSSRIWGVEFQEQWRPFDGFMLSGSATYVNSKILANDDGTPYMAFPQREHDLLLPVSGNPFPFTPRWSANLDAQYDWALNTGLNAFIGGSVTGQTRSTAGLAKSDPGQPTDTSDAATTSYNDPTFSLPGYALFDLRAGIHTADGRWRASIWGKNITNKYYKINVVKNQDTITRYTGYPASYGVTVGYKF